MFQNLSFLEVDWNLGINVTIVGLVIVFAMLILLVIILELFGFFSNLGTKSDNKTKVKIQKNSNKTSTNNVSDEEILAVITAAANNYSDSDVIPVIAAAVAYMYEGSSVKPVIRAVKKSGGNVRPAWTSAGIYENTRAF